MHAASAIYADRRIRAVLTDIEGTTSSIAFVRDVLFPYAREHLAAYAAAHRRDAEVRRALDDVRASEGLADDDAAVATLLRWIDEDRKATPLKTLQGLIWAGAYTSGAVRGHFYEDAVAALRRWSERDVPVYVYSSGSIAAQKLIFRHSVAGDLTPLVRGHFDTTTGPKSERASYLRIAETIALRTGNVLFLSDSREEIAAAQDAGMRTALMCRPDDAPARAGDTCYADFTGLDAIILR